MKPAFNVLKEVMCKLRGYKNSLAANLASSARTAVWLLAEKMFLRKLLQERLKNRPIKPCSSSLKAVILAWDRG